MQLSEDGWIPRPCAFRAHLPRSEAARGAGDHGSTAAWGPVRPTGGAPLTRPRFGGELEVPAISSDKQLAARYNEPAD